MRLLPAAAAAIVVALPHARGAGLEPFPAGPPFVQRAPAPSAKGGDYAALRKALDARGAGVLLLPAGTYTVNGCLVSSALIRGEGRDRTVVRLVSAGAPPKSGADAAFRLTGNARLERLSVEVAGGASNACGVEVAGAATLEEVEVRSAGGAGDAGVVVAPSAHALLRDVRAVGFPAGIAVRGSSTLLTAESLALEGQTGAGLRVDAGCAVVRGLRFSGSGSAAEGGAASLLAIEDAVCAGAGAAAGKPAIVAAGAAALRAVRVSGFARAVGAAGAPQGAEIGEWCSRALAVRGGKPPDVPWRDPPPPADFPFEQWQAVAAADATNVSVVAWGRPQPQPDCSPAFARACEAGKPVVWLPPGRAYGFFGTVRVPASVRCIEGARGALYEVFHGSGTRYRGELVVEGAGDPLEVRNLSAHKANLTVRHRGARPLVLRGVGSFAYEAAEGAGPVFMERCSPTRVVLAAGQAACFLAVDLRGSDGPRIANRGGVLYARGLRAESWATLVEGTAGAGTRIEGAMALATTVRPKDPLFAVAAGGMLRASLVESPVFDVPYERLVCDAGGAVLLRRDAGALRGGPVEEGRPAGSSLPGLAVGP